MWLGTAAGFGAGTFFGVPAPAVPAPAVLDPPSVQDLLAGSRIDLAEVIAFRAGAEVARLPVISGTVTVEAARHPRWSLNAQVAGLPEWSPADAAHVLSPDADVELAVRIGIDDPRLPAPYWWALGRYAIDEITAGDDGEGGLSISLAAFDRSQRISGDLMLSTVQVPRLTPVHEAVARILVVAAPWLPTAFTATGALTGGGIIGGPGANGWAAAVDAARQGGLDLWIDRDGAARLTRPVDPLSGEPVVTWEPGPGSQVVQLDHRRQRMPAAIIVQWSGGVEVVPNSQATPRIVYDGDTSSIPDADQARTAGATQLMHRQGESDEVTLTVWSDPRRDIDDIVRVIDPHLGATIRGRITGITWALGSPRMQVRIANRKADTP